MGGKRGSFPTKTELLKTVAGTCLVHHLGYWTVKLCHQRKIVQYHEVQGRKEPLYSLGTYDPLLDRSRRTSKQVRSITHSFASGQHCDETNAGRHSTVTYRCCSGKPHPAIAGFQETNKCEYHARAFNRLVKTLLRNQACAL